MFRINQASLGALLLILGWAGWKTGQVTSGGRAAPVAAPTEGPVSYEEFGAVGDGVADDLPAICKALEYANAHNLPVDPSPTRPITSAARRSRRSLPPIRIGAPRVSSSMTPT